MFFYPLINWFRIICRLRGTEASGEEYLGYLDPRNKGNTDRSITTFSYSFRDVSSLAVSLRSASLSRQKATSRVTVVFGLEGASLSIGSIPSCYIALEFETCEGCRRA